MAQPLDVFANLELSQTEKCVLGAGLMDDNDFTKFSGYGFSADDRPELEDWEYEGPYLRAFFCEGDFGSLFPKLDPRVRSIWIGVSLLADNKSRSKKGF